MNEAPYKLFHVFLSIKTYLWKLICDNKFGIGSLSVLNSEKNIESDYYDDNNNDHNNIKNELTVIVTVIVQSWLTYKVSYLPLSDVQLINS